MEYSGVLCTGFCKKIKPVWLLFLGFFFAGLHYAHADHLVKFEIKELEWNGTLKKYGKPRYVDVEFRNQSRPVYVDSFSGKVLFFRCIYKPVFSDNGEYPAFYGIIFDSAHKGSSITSKSVYEEKMIDASAKEKDKEGRRARER